MVTNQNMRRLVLSPDQMHSMSIIKLRDGCLCIGNNNKVPFGFSITRNKMPLAVVQYDADALKINTNWRVSQNGVENREIHTNPNLVVSTKLNFEIGGNGLGRLDLKIDDSGYAACVFATKELLFIKMNGNRTVPRLEGFMATELNKMVGNLESENSGAFERLGKKWFQGFVRASSWLSK